MHVGGIGVSTPRGECIGVVTSVAHASPCHAHRFLFIHVLALISLFISMHRF
jgi:hypothetical protein